MTRAFVIVAAPRTGSTMLETAINSHPDALSCGEVLNDEWVAAEAEIWWPDKGTHRDRVTGDAALRRLRRRDPVAFLNQLFHFAEIDEFAQFGFKMLYLHGQRCHAAVEYMAQIEHLRVIHLRRRNQLRRLLSEKLAMQRGVWNLRRGEDAGAPPAIELDAEDCVRNFELIAEFEARYDAAFAARPRLDVDYEELVARPEAQAARVLEFLGLPPQQTRFATKKLAVRPLDQAIANFADLRAHFAGTRWSTFFA